MLAGKTTLASQMAAKPSACQITNTATMHKHPLLLLSALLTTLLTACGVDGHHFKIEGRILNMNQGEFYVYTHDNLLNGIDTIKVSGGRFAMEIPCEQEGTIMLVFPNYSVQPIFAQPGKSVEVQGDASHLKELKVTGTKDNELMTKFRELIAKVSPPEVKKYVRQFVDHHPQSAVGGYLVRQYFVTCPDPDYAEAATLVEKMRAKQPDNSQLALMANMPANYDIGGKYVKLPNCTDYDTRDRLVSSTDLSGGLGVVCTWASWNHESLEQLRRIRKAQKKSGGRLKVVSICIDASKKDCEKALQRDSITWPNICDGKIFEGRTINQLGLLGLPDNIFVKNGRIIARGVTTHELEKFIEQHL